MKKFRLYQIKRDAKGAHDIKFSSLEFLKKHKLMKKLTPDLYGFVYEGTTAGEDTDEMLEDIFMRFQGMKPEGFNGHSVSTSDVVVMDGKTYYCDEYGWKEIDLDLSSVGQ